MAGPASAQTEFLGPLRIHDLTPFNILRLEMRPADAAPTQPGAWTFDGDLSWANTHFENTPDIGVSRTVAWLAPGTRRL